mmetsp:Transcript_54315/g.172489  ORF Transcript_54315/g.172489 Transcript_54315/m.172489 type:complete len:118 (+) Transcript_54315:961-1314(+)
MSLSSSNNIGSSRPRESPCGGKCLLGRVKRFRSGMYTALSGFVEQGESLEEAVVREVQEEAGVGVSSIHVVGSQPWPVGRASLERVPTGAASYRFRLSMHHHAPLLVCSAGPGPAGT